MIILFHTTVVSTKFSLLVRGGLNMSQSPLRFSLKEAVWFKKGQEVEQLLSIELNPQITIEEQSNYVQVVGSLELYGEYMKQQSDEMFSLRDFSQVKVIEQVDLREDGVCEFTHHFPIDITIPKSRVNDYEEIYVLVDSFDYDLRDNNELDVVADLSISGLQDEELLEETDLTLLGDTFETLQFKARKSPVIEEVEQEIEHPQLEFLNRVIEEKVELDVTEPVVYEIQKTEELEQIQQVRNENELQLTRIFSNEVESFKKIRMYIVQSGDSLETIAEKYELQTSQILRRNKIGNQLEAGQILYLPVKK